MDSTARLRSGVVAVLNKTLLYVALAFVAFVAMFPFWWMLVASTRTADTILTLPPPLWPGDALEKNLDVLFSSIPYLLDLLNSIFVGASYTVLTLFFCSLGGYAFAKFKFAGRDRLFALVLITLMIPTVLGLIPSYVLMRWFGWLDTWYPLIIPGAASAFGIFWMRQYIAGAMPDELIDAARIDGAGEFRIYWNIVLPVIKPALGALAIFSFLVKWSEFLWPLLILKDPNKYTLPVAIASLQNRGSSEELGVIILAATMAILPVLIVFIFASRKFIAGLTIGAVKGG